MVFGMVAAYWKALQAVSARTWPLRKLPAGIKIIPLPAETAELARITGTAAARLNVDEASYMIGVIYTGLLPDRFRAKLGAYYTPPTLCERLLDMATNAGVDWRSARVLDPGCGGGAFLSPVARRMAESLKDCEASIVLDCIQQNLQGFDLDSFAAWMSQVYLDATLNELYHRAGKRLQPVVRVCDSLEQSPGNQGFDLVIGNPPYGRVTLSPVLRRKFSRSLFGHANLYGIFTDLALRYTRTGGVIAFVTPTSFLSGEYFKALRGLLGREAPPRSIDFIGARKGVFSGVLQETLLAVYQRGAEADTGMVHFVSPGCEWFDHD